MSRNRCPCTAAGRRLPTATGCSRPPPGPIRSRTRVLLYARAARRAASAKDAFLSTRRLATRRNIGRMNHLASRDTTRDNERRDAQRAKTSIELRKKAKPAKGRCYARGGGESGTPIQGVTDGNEQSTNPAGDGRATAFGMAVSTAAWPSSVVTAAELGLRELLRQAHPDFDFAGL